MNNRLLAVTPDCDSIVACGEDSLYYYSGLLSNNISQKNNFNTWFRLLFSFRGL